MAALRLLIYARGTQEEIAAQQEECFSRIAQNEVVAAVATDPPGEVTGWISANSMFDAGEIDAIRVASRDIIPTLDHVQSVTHEIRKPGAASQRSDEPPWQRRPRRLRDGFRRRS